MSMLERSTRPRPSFAEWSDMWKEIDVAVDSRRYAAVEQYVNELRSLYVNGQVLSYSFVVPPQSVFDYFVALGDFKFLEFPARFWALPTVRESLPQLNIGVGSVAQESMEGVDSFVLAGEMAGVLRWGGAYAQSRLSAGEMKRLAEAACADWFGERFDESVCWLTRETWNDFFFDVAWDLTLVVLDKRERRVHVIVGTDTD